MKEHILRDIFISTTMPGYTIDDIRKIFLENCDSIALTKEQNQDNRERITMMADPNFVMFKHTPYSFVDRAQWLGFDANKFTWDRSMDTYRGADYLKFRDLEDLKDYIGSKKEHVLNGIYIQSSSYNESKSIIDFFRANNVNNFGSGGGCNLSHWRGTSCPDKQDTRSVGNNLHGMFGCMHGTLRKNIITLPDNISIMTLAEAKEYVLCKKQLEIQF